MPYKNAYKNNAQATPESHCAHVGDAAMIAHVSNMPLAAIPPVDAGRRQEAEDMNDLVRRAAGQKVTAKKPLAVRTNDGLTQHVGSQQRTNEIIETQVKMRAMRGSQSLAKLTPFHKSEKTEHWTKKNPTIADVLDLLWHEWKSKGKPQGFMRWVEEHSGQYLEQKIPHQMVNQFFSGLVYLGVRRRTEHLLTVSGGKLYQQGQLFDTQQIESIWEEGVAIFVMSPSGDLFAGPQATGEFHHSSFLGGKKVAAAGEMVAHAGALKLLTGKSGHYRPASELLVNAVKRLTQLGLREISYKVRVYPKDNKNLPLRNADPNCLDPWTTKKVKVGDSAPVYLTAFEFVRSHQNYSIWGYDELTSIVGAPA